MKRATLFASPADCRPFERVLVEALERIPLRILAFCVMPNHRHLVAHRAHGDPARLLAPGPLALLEDWSLRVNLPETEQELEALRRCAARGVPLGSPDWVQATATEWGLLPTMRPVGRPRGAAAPRT